MKRFVMWLGAALFIGSTYFGFSDFMLDASRNITCGEPFGGIPSNWSFEVEVACGQVRALRGTFAAAMLFTSLGLIIGGFTLPSSPDGRVGAPAAPFVPTPKVSPPPAPPAKQTKGSKRSKERPVGKSGWSRLRGIELPRGKQQ